MRPKDPERRFRRISRLTTVQAVLLGLIVAWSSASRVGAATSPSHNLATASALVDGERPEEAVALLDQFLRRQPKDPGALLLRSTAHFMLGNMGEGKRDLDLSIALDPGNRQAWLNRAALELADQNYAQALEAFGRAEVLEHSAADNSLNIGTVLLLLDRFDEARERFKDYLARNPGDPAARYLVASNYALRGFAQPAVANLSRAVAMDERYRRRARTDPNFEPLLVSPAFQELLNTDSFRHPPGSRIVTRSYELPYAAGQSEVLDAVIGTLQLEGRVFDPQVEVTPAWALIWSDLRIKVVDAGAGKTLLELSAAPGRLDDGSWLALTEQLFRGVTVQLHTRSLRKLGQ